MITDAFISLYYPFLLSVSFSLVLPAMINLFKKNIHSLFTHPTTISELGLITATEDLNNNPNPNPSPPNVLESSKLKTDSPQPPPAERGWIDGTGGGGGSCTESLGSESSDEIHNENVGSGDGDGEVWRRRMVRAEGRGNRRRLRSFPPPLSSLNRSGKPSFFLRPVRKDGRLELTEVRIHRPEILHASRHDGRLTLHLIPDQINLEEDEEEEIEEEEEEEEEHEEEELVEEEEEELEEEEIELDEEKEEEIECEREEERVAEWGFHEGFRRCHEMVNQQHRHRHHHNHVHGNHHHHLRTCGISIV